MQEGEGARECTKRLGDLIMCLKRVRWYPDERQTWG